MVYCREENPNLVSAYNKYRNKNFTIVSISLDENKNEWLNAIRTDSLSWTNVSDLRGQQNQIALKYGVNGIPANFLIDPNGKIIAKDLQGEELSTKLKVLLQ